MKVSLHVRPRSRTLRTAALVALAVCVDLFALYELATVLGTGFASQGALAGPALIINAGVDATAALLVPWRWARVGLLLSVALTGVAISLVSMGGGFIIALPIAFAAFVLAAVEATAAKAPGRQTEG